MNKNELFLLSEVIYQLHACESWGELERVFFDRISLYIPFRFASYIQIQEDPGTGKRSHTLRFCCPDSFAAVERQWIDRMKEAGTAWLSSGSESVVVRSSELFAGDSRLRLPVYRDLFRPQGIFDDMQMNLVREGKTVGRIAFFRIQEDGPFTDEDVVKLRLLSKHINLVFGRCEEHLHTGPTREDIAVLAERFGLTRRETEIVACIFRGMDNGEISDELKISKNTLYKHNNNIFQKCGIKSRWELLRLCE